MDEIINTPFSYTGSKFKLLPQLLPLFDYTKVNFIDVFAGGGSIYTNIASKYEKVWINDKLADWVLVHKELVTRGEEFVKEVIAFCSPKDNQAAYVSLRALYNKERLPAQLMALGLCAQNNFLRYNKSGEFNQTWGKRSFNDSTRKKLDKFIPHIQQFKDKLYFTSLDFDKVIPKSFSNCMVYIDPPYNSQTQGAANYNAFWDDNDDERLFKYCENVHNNGGSFCVSNVWSENKEFNALLVNLLIDDGRFNMVKLNGDYKKVARIKTKEQMTEIIIKNY